MVQEDVLCKLGSVGDLTWHDVRRADGESGLLEAFQRVHSAAQRRRWRRRSVCAVCAVHFDRSCMQTQHQPKFLLGLIKRKEVHTQQNLVYSV